MAPKSTARAKPASSAVASLHKASPASSGSKKRANPETDEVHEDEGLINGQKELEIKDDDEEDEDGSDDEQLEIDTGSSNGDLEDFEDNEDDSEEGYNSSDIDALEDEEDDDEDFYAGSSPSTSVSGKSSSELDRLFAKHTVKPLLESGNLDPTQLSASFVEREGEEDEEFIDQHHRITGGRRLDNGKLSSAKEGVGRMVKSKLVPGGWMREYDEIEAGYGSESSTEDNPNTVGDIPMEWYDDLPHIGYSVDGKKIMRPAKGDELDKFLATVEDPDSWTTAEDKALQKQVQLSDKELDIIRRLQNAENPDGEYDPYQDTTEWFTGKGMEMITPLSGQPEPKRRFVPSKWEHKKVMKIVKAIREGRIIPNKPAVEKPKVYGIWSNADQENAPHAMYMPAPQLPPPRTVESYNPPEEFLFDEGERKEWEEAEKEDRKINFQPQKHAALRLVPGYANLVQERFERCLDLYLAPRTRKVKMNIDPESLVPKLPNPRELRPFPVQCAVQYRHPANSRVRCVSVDARGEWVASGSEDGVVRLWDLGNGREVLRWALKAGPIHSVQWTPNRDESVLAVTVTGRVYLLSPLALVSPAVAQTTLTHLNAGFASSSASNNTNAGKQAPDAKWVRPSEEERDRGIMVVIEVAGTPKQVTWHRKGDYLSTVAGDAANKAVLIHQITKHQSQSPFKKSKGSIQRVAFHPNKPYFFVATQRYVRMYDLVAQRLMKTLMSGLKWISSMDIHPGGDNLIIGSYDKKLCWFDMDLSTKPYKTLR